jgi:hypothetical protein
METGIRVPRLGLNLRDFFRPPVDWLHAFVSERVALYSMGVPPPLEWSRASMMDVYDYKF